MQFPLWPIGDSVSTEQPPLTTKVKTLLPREKAAAAVDLGQLICGRHLFFAFASFFFGSVNNVYPGGKNSS